MARTPLAESNATEPRVRRDQTAEGISRHGNAVDAAEIRAELDARMASTMQSRGNGERIAEIRELIGRIGEILSEEPDPPSPDRPALSPGAEPSLDYVAEFEDVHPWGSDADSVEMPVADASSDSASGESEWSADHDEEGLDVLVDDAGFGSGTLPAESFPEDRIAAHATEYPIDEIAPPDHSASGDAPAAADADEGSDRIAAADPFAGEMLANAPLGYWRLGERNQSNGQARDETGTAPGTWHPGPAPGAEFATVSIPDHPAWRLAAGTVQFWIRPGDTRTRQGLIVRSSGNAGAPNRFTVTLESTDIAVQLHGPHGSTITARGLIDDHAWHQIAVTFGDDGCEIWIDGALVARDPSIVTGIDRFDGGWVVGAGADPDHPDAGDLAAAPFAGSIAEFAIFDTQLGPAAIRGLYDAGINGTDVMVPSVTEPVEHAVHADSVETAASIDVIADSADGDDSSGATGVDYPAGPDFAEPPTYGEPAADVDVTPTFTDFTNTGTSESTSDDVPGPHDTDPSAAGQDASNEMPLIESEGGIEAVGVPSQSDNGWTVAGGWTVTLTAGTVEADDGVSLILSKDAAGTITLPDGSEIRFNRMARIDYGPRSA